MTLNAETTHLPWKKAIEPHYFHEHHAFNKKQDFLVWYLYTISSVCGRPPWHASIVDLKRKSEITSFGWILVMLVFEKDIPSTEHRSFDNIVPGK